MERELLEITEVAIRLRTEPARIHRCIDMEWLILAEPTDKRLDYTDIARLNLIFDLIDRMGVNDEAVPIILNLIDQIQFLRAKTSELFSDPI